MAKGNGGKVKKFVDPKRARAEAFNKAMGKLCEKHKCSLIVGARVNPQTGLTHYTVEILPL
jgi:hypothetical protein